MAGSDLPLFEQSPEAFSVYLKELEQQGLPKEQLDFVRREYQRHQGGLKDPFKEPNKKLAEEGRTRANLLPVSKPEGRSVVEAFKEGSLELAVPGAITEGVAAATDAQNTAGNLLKGVPYTKADLEESAVNAAGMSLGVGAAAPVPKGALRTFGGLNARDRDRGAFSKASQMAESNINPERIWRETGWFKDPVDKKWRFEIDDSKAEFLDLSDDVLQAVQGPGATLKEVFKHDDLYRQYSEIANLRVNIVDDLPEGALGYATQEGIVLSSALDEFKARGTMLHELQHLIQDYEGFTKGTNPDFMQSKHPEAIGDRFRAFAFYEGKGGEIEARLVENRQFLPPEVRKIYYPLDNRDRIAGDKKFENAFGDTNLKPGVSDIVADVGDIAKVFSQSELGKRLLELDVGDKIEGKTFETYSFVEPRQLGLRGASAAKSPDIRLKDGRIFAMELRGPNGEKVYKPVGEFLQDVGENLEEWRP